MAETLRIDADEVRTVAGALGYLDAQLKNASEALTWQLSILEVALQYTEVGTTLQIRQALSSMNQVTQLLQIAQTRLMEVVNDTLHLEVDLEQGSQGDTWHISDDVEQYIAQHGFLSYGGLYAMINGNTERGDPFTAQPDRIAITQGVGPDGQPVVLVTLRGLDIGGLQTRFHLFGPWYQDYNLANALLGGMDENNAYKQDVERSIQQYLAEHGLPPDTKIVVAGHSFGGIVAQQLVEDSGQTHFNIQEVITYGSPNLGVDWGSTTHHMFADRYDGVPLLSLHENALPLALFGNDPLNPLNMAGGATGAVGGFFHGLFNGGLGEAVKEGGDWGFVGGHITGLPATIVADGLLNGHPALKSLYTGGETIVAGQGDSGSLGAWFGPDHGAYSAGQIYGGGTLQGTPIDFQIYDLGPTQYFDPPATPPSR